jgi:recombination associated protein RdgC
VGFLSASSTVVRFIAEPPSSIDRDAVARAVTRRSFRDNDDGEGSPQSFGWVDIHDPLSTTLGPADLFFQQFLVVGFRYDRRAVPAKLLFLERRRAENAMRAERGMDRLGKALRTQIKADVEARLLARALPAPRLYDCVWNLETGRVYLTGKQRAARDAFVEHFRQTFGVTPVPLIPYLAAEHVGLPTRVVEALRAVEPASFTDVAVPQHDPEIPRLPIQDDAR